MGSFTFLLVICSLASVCLADIDNHLYQEKEPLIVWANKVGPFHNPHEVYSYFSLPFCKPESETHKEDPHGFSDLIQGYELESTGIVLKFKENQPKTTLCEVTLESDKLNTLSNAVEEKYWYQMSIDDLPVWGMVGETLADPDNQKNKLFVYTHKDFSLAYNGDRVIEANLTSESPVHIVEGTKLTFTFSVSWFATAVEFEDRFDRYLDSEFFEHQIHWFSVFNSFMMVVFLVGLVAMILMRALKKDYAKFDREDVEVETDRDGDDSGWKHVHGDVFRAPPRLGLLSALLGTGHQLVTLVFLVLILCMIGYYYKDRGYISTAMIVCYAFTSFVGGYGGGGFYARSGGKKWIRVMLITASLFPGVCFAVAMVMDWVAMSYGSANAIPLSSMLTIGALWALISFPLTIFGTLIGRNSNGSPDRIPCRINQVPRQIPDKPWYMGHFAYIMMSGILPYGSIFIEMHFLFTSFWHYKYYYVYGFLLVVFILLIIVIACVTIVGTYFLLNSEDYRWQWVSFLSGASTALYVFLYSVYYFYFRTKMTGLMQISFYFGYMFMFSFGLAIVCGSIAFVSATLFVRRIYRNIKVD